MTLDEFEMWIKRFIDLKDGAVNCSLENKIKHIKFMLKHIKFMLKHIKFMLDGVEMIEDRAFLMLKYSEYLL